MAENKQRGRPRGEDSGQKNPMRRDRQEGGRPEGEQGANRRMNRNDRANRNPGRADETEIDTDEVE